MNGRSWSLPRIVAGAHAVYLLATGLWPLAHRASFERVTGPKRDFWLVRTIGGLAALQGLTLAGAVVRGRPSADARTLALGSGVVFTLADLYAARRVSRVYLGDTVVQAAFAAAWIVGWGEQRLREKVDGSHPSAQPSRVRPAAPTASSGS